MSRFFAAGSSDSESSEGEVEQPILTKPAARTARPYFFSDDEEETRRVVRSQKDKRFQELSNSIKQLKNHKKIKDMAKVLTEFEALGKAFSKAKAVVDKEGIPPFFIRSLAELEDFVKVNWEDSEGRKKLSKINAKALATLRQKLRKYIKDFEGEITKYRENPTVSGESSAEERSDAEEDDDTAARSDFYKKSQFEPAKKGDTRLDSEDDDDSDWPSTDDETSSSSSDDERGPMELHASMFLKKKKDTDDKTKKEKKVKQKPQKAKVQDEEGWTQVKTPREKAKQLFPKDTEITHAVVLKKLQELLAHRGKKGTDRVEQIEFLKELRQISDDANLGPAMTVKLLFNIISSIFDYNPNVATCMKAPMWQECLKELLELIEALTEHKEISIGENISEESENVQNLEEPLRVRGCVMSMVERMDEEFTKMLQGCDCHSTEYVERLTDEVLVCQLIEKLQSYLEDTGSRSEICRVYLRRIEHFYYKVELSEMRNAQKKRAEVKKADGESPEKGAVDSEEKENSEQKENTEEKENDEEKENAEEKETAETTGEEEVKTETTPKGPGDAETMNHLCKFIYSKDTSDRIRTRAMLCHVYHHAIHDRFYEARDLMLMSHLQESIQHSDIPTQILYNRTMVQLGLCAFRHGMIRDAHNALNDVQSSGRAKELLAQGLMQPRQYAERTPEQEKIEKRRQVPFHMHINLELLECVYLTSAMLLEIPYMAAHAFDYRRRIISKSFHYQLRQSDKQTLVGPPESMREHVVAASKAMKIGNWKKCRDYILAVKVWTLFSQPEQVRDMLSRKIQEESLRTYLFTYNHVYDSLSLHTLADMFELPGPVVHSIISKMIINEELQASWDEPTQTVVMHRGAEPTLLQSLALQLAEKVSNLVENNERIYDSKHGGFMQFKERQGGDRRQTGDRRQAPGDRRQAQGDRRQAPGDRRQAPGDRRQASGQDRRGNSSMRQGGRYQRQYQRDY